MPETTISEQIKISIIDSNPISRLSFHKQLELFGYQIDNYEKVELVENISSSPLSDIYIFKNIQLAHNNLTILHELSIKFKKGIIFLADAPRYEDKIYAIEQCADIYLCSSVDNFELNAYIKSLYRRLNPIQNSYWKFDTKNKALISKNNSSLYLTKNDFVVLKLLINPSNSIISREEIAQSLKISNKFYQLQLNTIISRIRNKLEYFDTRLTIQTVREIGYVYKGPRIFIE